MLHLNALQLVNFTEIAFFRESHDAAAESHLRLDSYQSPLLFQLQVRREQ